MRDSLAFILLCRGAPQHPQTVQKIDFHFLFALHMAQHEAMLYNLSAEEKKRKVTRKLDGEIERKT